MAVARTGPILEEEIAGERRPLLLRNGEIERFEAQYDPLGIFEVWDGLCGRGRPPQSRHVRDLIALGLIGAGMPDRRADELLAGLPPSDLVGLKAIAFRLLGVTFMPEVLKAPGKKPAPADGSPAGRRKTRRGATTPAPSSGTSAG